MTKKEREKSYQVNTDLEALTKEVYRARLTEYWSTWQVFLHWGEGHRGEQSPVLMDITALISLMDITALIPTLP